MRRCPRRTSFPRGVGRRLLFALVQYALPSGIGSLARCPSCCSRSSGAQCQRASCHGVPRLLLHTCTSRASPRTRRRRTQRVSQRERRLPRQRAYRRHRPRPNIATGPSGKWQSYILAHPRLRLHPARRLHPSASRASTRPWAYAPGCCSAAAAAEAPRRKVGKGCTPMRGRYPRRRWAVAPSLLLSAACLRTGTCSFTSTLFTADGLSAHA